MKTMPPPTSDFYRSYTNTGRTEGWNSDPYNNSIGHLITIDEMPPRANDHNYIRPYYPNNAVGPRTCYPDTTEDYL